MKKSRNFINFLSPIKTNNDIGHLIKQRNTQIYVCLILHSWIENDFFFLPDDNNGIKATYQNNLSPSYITSDQWPFNNNSVLQIEYMLLQFLIISFSD